MEEYLPCKERTQVQSSEGTFKGEKMPVRVASIHNPSPGETERRILGAP